MRGRTELRKTTGGRRTRKLSRSTWLNLEALEDRTLLSFTEYPIPIPNSGASSLTVGSDGNIWFAQLAAMKIGRMTPAGEFASFDVPGIYQVTTGPDGNVWAASAQHFMAKVTPQGVVTSSATLPPNPMNGWGATPNSPIAGPDGAVWFVAHHGNYIGRITTDFAVTTYALPAYPSYPSGLAVGSDGNFWVSEPGVDKIGQLNPATGMITEFAIPTANSNATSMSLGPDGNIWFTEAVANKIGRITPGGTIAEYAVPTPNSNPGGIVRGPDGALWFTEITTNKLGRITTGGSFTEYAIPTPDSRPAFLTFTPDGSLWFTENGANKIGRFDPTGIPTQISTTTSVSSSANPSTYGQNVTFSATVTPSNDVSTPSGSVQFLLDGSDFGTPVTLVNGLAMSAAIDTLVAGSHTITANYSGDTSFSSSSGSLSQIVEKAHLSVSVPDASRLYGQPNATFPPPSISGFVNGDTVDVVRESGHPSTTATSTSGVGTYPITVDLGTLSATNYDFPTLINGTLTINKAHLTVTAANASRPQGTPNPDFVYSITGFVNGDMQNAVSGKAALTTPATPASPADTYPITVGLGTLAAKNYDFLKLVNGALVVTTSAPPNVASASASPVTVTTGATLITTWSTTGTVDHVALYLIDAIGSKVAEISTNRPSGGIFNWAVPPVVGSGVGYKVKVVAFASNTNSDPQAQLTTNSFQISPVPANSLDIRTLVGLPDGPGKYFAGKTHLGTDFNSNWSNPNGDIGRPVLSPVTGRIIYFGKYGRGTYGDLLVAIEVTVPVGKTFQRRDAIARPIQGDKITVFLGHLTTKSGKQVKVSLPLGAQVVAGQSVIGYVADKKHNGGYNPHIHVGILPYSEAATGPPPFRTLTNVTDRCAKN